LPDTRWIAPAALAVALASLAVNAVLWERLQSPERVAGPAVERVLRRLAAEDARLRYEVRLPAGTPVHLDVPVDEQWRVKVNTTLPIDTRIRLPVRTPVGSWDVAVPVKADVPIRADLPVRVRDTFRLRARTQAEIVAPIEVRVRDLPLDALHRALNP
jgi:hypothetical protein